MNKVKNYVIVAVLLTILGLTIYFRNDITTFILEKIILKEEVIAIVPNQYKLSYNYEYVKNTDDFYAKDKKQLVNILYTTLNSGADSFYFYCQYNECEKDINSLANENELVNLNSFVHPFNIYRKINISINTLNKVSITIERAYAPSTIVSANDKIDEIIKNNITDNMSIEDKIRTFHDYIINNTQYDVDYIDKKLSDIDSPSHKATGPLFYGKSLCGGYADVMSVFLNKINVENYRISSEFHVWNYVKIDNNWYHLDLTWDDPITSNGSNVLLHTFFLIDDAKLTSMNTGYHNYDRTVYKSN